MALRNVKYRGISGVVRRAVNKNEIVGEITADKVRGLLPEEKKSAPDHTILNSLRRLADAGEIQEENNKFYPKTRTAISPTVSVIGELKSLKTTDGVTTVTIKVSEMEYL